MYSYRPVAVHAENAKTIREIIFDEPGIKRPFSDLPSMTIPAAADMINGQQFNMRFPAARTFRVFSAIESKNSTTLIGLILSVVLLTKFPMCQPPTPS